MKRLYNSNSLVLYADYRNVLDREVRGSERFMLQLKHGNCKPGKVIVSTDAYRHVLSEVANDISPLQGPDARLVEFGAGAAASRVTEPEAVGLFALV